MPLLDTIDTNPKDNNIDIQELQDALKPQGFLSKQENIQKVSEELQKTDKDKISETLEKTINIQIEKIQEKSSLNDDEVKIIHLWFSLFGEKPGYNETKEKLKKQIDKITEDIAHKVDKLIGANAKGNTNYYTPTDIRTIQLRANTHFGDPILLDGSRGNIINIAQNTANQKQTNLYIYRLELMYREDITKTREELGYNQIFEHLLQTPNLEDLLNTLPKQSQNKVLGEFLDFYLREVKQNGMFFEDKIGGEALGMLLIYMIQTEKNKGSIEIANFYKTQTSILKQQIKETNQITIEQNYHETINNKIRELENVGSEQKDKKQEIFKQLLDLAEKTNNNKLKENILIMISNTFTEQEIQTNFGGNTLTELDKTREAISKELSENEYTNDILSQIENAKIGNRSVRRSSRSEYINTRPHDALANQKGLRGTIRDYAGEGWEGKYYSKNGTYTQFCDSHVPGDTYTVDIPGGGSITVRINNDNIQDLINLGNKLNKDTYLVLPGYTKEFSKTNSSNTVTSYNYDKMDHTEKEKNILDLNDFAVAKKQENGDIALHKMTSANQYSTKPYEIITQEKQTRAKTIQSLAIASNYTPEAIGLYNDVGSIQNSMVDIQTIYNKMGTAKVDRGNIDALGVIFALSNPISSPLIDTYIPVTGGIDEKDVTSIFTQATLMKEKVNELKGKNSTLIKIRDQIKKMESSIDKSKILTNEENKIIQALNAVNFLIEGTKEGGRFDEFIDHMTNPKYVSANGSFTALGIERLKNNGLKFALAIGAAVGVMSAPFTGGMSLVGVAALGTLAGMGGARLGQRANEGLQNSVFQRQITINGKIIDIDYRDPTDIEMLSNGKLSPQDFATSVGREFVVGTVSMYGFMKAGQILGKSLSKFVEANPTSKLSKVLKTLKPEFAKVQDPYTQNIFDNIAKKGSEKGFFNKFTHEFGQEVGEEGMEGAADQSGIPGLAMLVTTWNSLTPGANTKLYSDNKVSIANIEKIDNNAIIEMNYNGDPNQLISHFTSKGFTLDANGNLSKQNETIPNITDIIKLTPSTASIQTRNMENIFSQYNMTINHNATDIQGNHINEVIFPTDIDPTKLQEFKTNIEKSGKGVITTNPDGSFTLQTTQETIIFNPKSYETEITNNQTLENIRTQAHTNYITKKSKLQENIQNETNPEKKKKLEKNMQKLEKAYTQFNAVIDGEIIMDQNYVGIRNIAKELGLDIETEQLPLLRLIVIAEIKHQTGKTEVTQADINTYINQQLPIDQTIQDVFGENFLNPVEFDGGDPISQINSILESFSVKNSELLSESDIQTLQKFTQGHIQSLIDGMGLTPAQAFDLTQKNIRKLIFQNIADKGLLSGSDHVIVHIVQGDVFNARQTLDQLNISDPKKKAQVKAMLGQIIVDHDIGYNMAIFENMIQIDETTGDHNKNTFFDATKDHPIYSRLFVEANEAYYIQMFGKENVDAMKVAMLDHSDIHSLDFSQADNLSTTQLLQQLIASADCMGVTHVDKLHALFMNQNMMLLLCKFDFINKSFAADDTRGIQLHQQVKSQMLAEIQTMYTNGTIDKTTAQYYTNAIEKGIDTYHEEGKNPNAFGLNFNMSSYIYATEGLTLNAEQNGGIINMSVDMGMFESVNSLYGGKLACSNLVKILSDYGRVMSIDGKDIPQEKEAYTESEKNSFGLHTIIGDAKLGDAITIQTQQPGGSIVTFDIQITQTPENNIGLKENLDKIALYNKDISANIQIIIKELGDNNFNQTTINKSLFSILTKDPEIGDQIQEILDSKDTAKTKQQKIQELRGANISQSFDAIITNNQVNDTQTELTTQQEQELIQQSNQELEQETKNIDQQIQQNKNNPEGLKSIIQSLITRSKNAVTELNAAADESIPMYKKTKHFLHAMNEMFVTHHALHEIHAMKDNSTIIYQAVMNKERRTAVGASIDLMTNVVIFTAVTKVHIAHLLHGDLVSGFYLQTSLTTSLDQIKNLSKHAKDILIGQQEQHNNYNEMQNRREQWTPENTDAMINNYLTNIKTLVRGRNREDIPGLQEKIQELYPDIQIQESVHDTLSDILAKIENSQGDIQKTHIENMHTFIEYLNPKQSLESEIRSFVSNMYSGISPRGDVDHITEAVTNPLGHTFGH